MGETNAALVRRCRNNDEAAFATLVCRYQSLVFGICMRMLSHRQDAEDVTQETLSRLVRNLDRWDSRRPLEPWLITIAGNRCRSFLARRRSWQSLSAAEEPTSESTREAQAAESLREEIRLAMTELPQRQRAAFELFHERSLDYAEIARRMGCPIGTAKTLVHRARNRLMEQLRERDVVAGGASRTPPEPPSVRGRAR